MSTMINDLKAPYYYCQENYSFNCHHFFIGWEYQKDYIDRFWGIDKSKFKLIE